MTNFEYLNLAEVNPEVEPVPPGDYQFRVIEAGIKTYASKKEDPAAGINIGDAVEYVKIGLSIINDPEQAGRKIFASLFADPKSARYLRLIQDATGVNQDSGEALSEWLGRLVTERATFAAPVFTKTDKEGKPRAEVRLSAAKSV